ncbi:MAG: hypothetical protein V2I26_08980 [Halieaceae bacterium]|jgi:hypothetical protein|nr:hypothetical protein [Halieaceae bacterium]
MAPGKLWLPEGFSVFISSKAVKALVDGLKGVSKIAETQKRARQLTLGQLMIELEKLPNTALLPLGQPYEYPGGGVAFSDDGFEWRPSLILQECRKLLVQSAFPVDRSAPAWFAHRGEPGAMITGVGADGALTLEYPASDIES